VELPVSLIYLIPSRGMPRMTATEAARNFSEVLNRVAAGEEFELTRSGAPVATIGPAKAQLISAGRFRELMASAPRPDADFARDVRAARESVGPPREPWPS
jgi:prevent-host-death family protein